MHEYDPTEVICICGECGSEQNMSKAENSPFLKEGLSHPCSICGGVCIIVERQDAANALKQIRGHRGI